MWIWLNVSIGNWMVLDWIGFDSTSQLHTSKKAPKCIQHGVCKCLMWCGLHEINYFIILAGEFLYLATHYDQKQTEVS